MSDITRRGFLKAIGIAGAGLALSRLPVPDPIKYQADITGLDVQKYCQLVPITEDLIADSIHVKFISEKTVYRLAYSFDPGDGQPVQHYDLANGTGSPFVKLAERT